MIRGRSESFRQPISKPKRVGPEYNPWWWNPNNVSIKFAPDWFRERLKDEMGSELEITWNPIIERWQLWSEASRIQNKICRGWRLLFIHNGPSGEHLPLDERIFARLYSASARANGNGKEYFARIQAEFERDQEKKESAAQQDAIDQAMPFYDHSQIKVGYGPSNGSKFSTYHS